MNYKQQLAALGGVTATVASLWGLKNSAIYKVDVGCKAFKFNKVSGVRMTTVSEGWHLKMPWFEKPIIYNVQSTPTKISSVTGSMDLQEVKLTLRVLYKPDSSKLQTIYRNLGTDYDQRVLPSIVNEVTKSVIAQYNASNLLAQRDMVSHMIRARLSERLRDFNIILDDVSIVDLVFGAEFTKAIENKQIAQQQAERAKYIVERAEQEKLQILIKAEGEAKAAEFFGRALKDSPAYIDLKRIDAAKEIARRLGKSNNKVYLDAETLLLNLTHGLDQNLELKQTAIAPSKQ
jgi:prohibitin 2